ncbi:hypothetical protein TNIN_201261 [Trichonephila inaurata madagascariensis]|uniref:Uncharacterized protein n=1 Tax=Trichonephila inaurata madagascariensis TaxID=2747483 RepID=A0A8X6YD74_9ARAC|nr:hypothetical protein TNIN_201261 [Trichonephila inaurata madagascariensis]
MPSESRSSSKSSQDTREKQLSEWLEVERILDTRRCVSPERMDVEFCVEINREERFSGVLSLMVLEMVYLQYFGDR